MLKTFNQNAVTPKYDGIRLVNGNVVGIVNQMAVKLDKNHPEMMADVIRFYAKLNLLDASLATNKDKRFGKFFMTTQGTLEKNQFVVELMKKYQEYLLDVASSDNESIFGKTSASVGKINRLHENTSSIRGVNSLNVVHNPEKFINYGANIEGTLRKISFITNKRMGKNRKDFLMTLLGDESLVDEYQNLVFMENKDQNEYASLVATMAERNFQEQSKNHEKNAVIGKEGGKNV